MGVLESPSVEGKENVLIDAPEPPIDPVDLRLQAVLESMLNSELADSDDSSLALEHSIDCTAARDSCRKLKPRRSKNRRDDPAAAVYFRERPRRIKRSSLEEVSSLLESEL